MSVLIDFYTGEIDIIQEALQTSHMNILENPSVVYAQADFSLRLSLDDLDPLTEEIGKILGEEAGPLSEYLTPLKGEEPVYDEEYEPGPLIERVDQELVQKIALLPDQKIEEVAESWCTAMNVDRKLPIHVTPDILKAIRALIHLCQTAIQNEKDVVLVIMI